MSSKILFRTQRAYSLIEIMIVIAIIAAATFGVVRFFQHDTAKAAVQQEQTNLASVVTAVKGLYATKNSFAGVSSAGLIASRSPGVRVDQGATNLLSAFGSSITVQPAQVLAPNDAFQVVYSGLNSSQCTGLIPAVAGGAYGISIGGGASVVSTGATTLGKINDPGQVATECAGQTFAQHAGTVVMTYYDSSRNSSGVLPPGCTVSCSPESETQTIACPAGNMGEINQSRSGTCGVGACPTLVWSPWTTDSSSCSSTPAAPPGPAPAPPPSTPPPACTPATFTRNQACPIGQVGTITQSQSVVCPSGSLSPWTNTSDTCTVPTTPACNNGANTQLLPCPAGYGGQITQMQNYTCASDGSHVNGPWFTVSNTCDTSCQVTGNCCTPSTTGDGQNNVSCSAGQYGQIVQTLDKSSSCSSPTAVPVFGPPFVVSSTGSCTACPATTTQTQTLACPPGQVGSINQIQSISYACSTAPTALPAPTYSAWTTTANTCAVAACTSTGGGVWSVNVLSMTTGPFTATPTAAYPIVTNGDYPLMKLGPTTARFVATGSVTFDMTVGAQTQQFTVACTIANSTLNSAGQITTDECQYTGVVTLNGISLNVDVDACGLPAQDYVVGSAVSCTSKVTIDQSACTAPTPATCLPYGNGVVNGVTVTPVDLNLSPFGDQGAVLGAYGSTNVADAPTGTAQLKLSYGGATQTVNVSCTNANNTSGGTIACIGPNTVVTVGGTDFLVYLQTGGPFLDQGQYWDAYVQVTQNCKHFALAGTSVVQTNVTDSSTVITGHGTELPENTTISSGSGPVTWVIPLNDRLGSGDGPFDPYGNKIYPYEIFLNMTGGLASAPQAGTSNPGYGQPTNPWASMYNNYQYTVYAGPGAPSYANAIPKDCTVGANLMIATKWGSNYPVELLYDGFSCIVGQVTIFSSPSGSPPPPTNNCPHAASKNPIGPQAQSHNSAPLMVPVCF
jgi:prepilin-type N-terminal cleavage/methylation domain-containing protein